MRSVLVFVLALLPVFVRAAEPDPLAHLRPGHPRLLLTDDQLSEAVAAARSDPLRAALHARIIALATAELSSAPIQHVLIGPRLLDKSRTALGRILNCALAFRLTGDNRFAERAKTEMFTAAAFNDWNPEHFLDVAEMSLGVALGYDWLYPVLTPAERATLKAALLRHALRFAPAAYADGKPTDKRLWFVSATHNWNQVCNGGLLAAALALADDEPALARTVIAGARRSLPLAMAAYAPDGAYPEGPSYWDYGTSYNVIAIALLEGTLGSDFGLTASRGFDRTALYRLHIQSPSGLAFNYADGGATLGAQAEYTWLAQRYHLPTALAHSRQLLGTALAKKPGTSSGDRFLALHAVWFPLAAQDPASTPAPLDQTFRGGAQLAVFRSAWDDPRALFLGFKAGSNAVNHAHLDLGSFVLDADGVRWAVDLGPDNYNLPTYFGELRWSYLRLNNFSHNTLTPGTTLQNPKAIAPLLAFASTPTDAHAVADLSAAYPKNAKKILRGVALLDRARVLIQDEVTALAAATPIHWRLATAAQIKLIDPRHAELTQAGKTLRAEILEPAAAFFSVSPANPPTAAEDQNRGTSFLTATVSPAATATDLRLRILLTPTGDRWPSDLALPPMRPLASWSTAVP